MSDIKHIIFAGYPAVENIDGSPANLFGILDQRGNRILDQNSNYILNQRHDG